MEKTELAELIQPIVENPASLYVDGVYVGEINTQYQLNNIRLKVKKGELEKVHFLFDDGMTNHFISCNPKGELDKWPEGFFDLIEDQLEYLLGWKK